MQKFDYDVFRSIQLPDEKSIIENWKNDIPSPLVSICCITYNHANFIEDAIRGFLIQITDFPFEIIIHDDASTDDTAKIIREYSKIYPKIIKPIFQTENQFSKNPRVSATHVWPNVKGDFIALCEGDDYWIDIYKLQKQIDFLETHKDYAGSAHQSIVISNNEIRQFRLDVPNEIGLDHILGGRLFHTASVVFRKTVLDLFFNAPIVLSGDRLLNFCIACTGKLHFFDDCMCVYRIHGSGLSSAATINQMLLDLNCIPYLKRICPSFPKYRYMSYVYATIGLRKKGSLYKKFYYIILSLLFSFSYFPNNIKFIFKRVLRLW